VKRLSTKKYGKLVDAVLSFDEDAVMNETKEALNQGSSPVDIVENGLGKALKVVGDKYENGEFWIMHIVAAADVVQKALDELIEPEIAKRKEERKVLGTVAMGTVAGDIHSIGKNIVSAMLTANGFKVYDIGIDKPVEDFINKAKEVDADMIGAAAMLTSTYPIQKEIMDALEREGLIDKIKLLVGGATVTAAWAEQIGAHYAFSATDAVKLAKTLI